ncbi:MAG TPA: DNA-3-methyladenine glycosylase [Rariglobus sp.]|jgi:DNA-3-methyladenine glycosylase|nr:DNA-3-methyladenine glycosylase [Rariglobus sp.]
MSAVIEAKLVQSGNTVALARMLLGKILATVDAGGVSHRARICETEAYHGEDDRACHASRARTARTEVMYKEGGVWYVYLCYGIHEMLNLVTGPREQPSAILIRGVEAVSGPGRLTRKFGIDRRFNGLAATPETGLWIEDDGFRPPAKAVFVTPRIGVDYAGPVRAAKPWRFYYTPEIMGRPSPAVGSRARCGR